MSEGELASSIVELTRDGDTRVALAHDGLDQHHLDEDIVGLGLCEGASKLGYVVGLDGDEVVVRCVGGEH